ncbi:type II toxin-antitoxin system PemK/MazF family toxin, partial [Streptococcus anginosus]|uniref:type II toxin-antitoxin system PemK/MazF family toxin n=2 Tax=Bacillota TaxID=1239 RepID=UPI0021F8F5DA
MVQQFDIIKLNLNTDEAVELGNYQPCVVISKPKLTQGSGFAWVMPILKHQHRTYPTDIAVESQEDIVRGIVDCIHIRSVDLKMRDYHVVDSLTD